MKSINTTNSRGMSGVRKVLQYFLLLFFTTAHGGSWADTISVSAGENLNDIIAAANAGDHILVGDGDFESFTVGESKTGLIIEADSDASPQIAGNSGSNRVIDIRGDDTVLRGFTIAAADDHVAISISGQNVTVENNTIVSGLTGIQTTTANSDGNALVRNNQISGTAYGLSIQNNNNSVSANTVESSTEGLGLIGDTQNSISGNDFDVSDGAAIALYVAFDVDLQALLENNQFSRLIAVRDGDGNIVTHSLYTSLQDAIDAASAGHRLELYDGDYQRATIDKSLTLHAIAGASANISGSGVNQGWGLRIAAGVSQVNIGASNQGLSISAAAGDLAAVYAVGNNHSLQLTDNIINGGSGHAFLAGGSGGAGLSDASLSGNQFSNNGSVATVYVNGQASLAVESSNISFTDNQLSSTAAGNGVLLGLETDNATVSNNSFSGESGYALLEIWNAGASISDNSFDNSGSGAVFRDSGSHYNMGTFVADNDVSDAAYIDSGHVLYSSIQDAIDAAVEGDLVLMSNGDFIEDITIATAGIRLAGNSEANLFGRLDISADDVSVSGLELSDPSGGYGIVVNGASNISLNNNYLHHIGSDAGYSGTAQAIYVHHNGIDTETQSAVSITNNTISNVGHGGISASNKGIFIGDSLADRPLDGLVISGNTISAITAKHDADFSNGGRGAYGILINWGVNGAANGQVNAASIIDNELSDINGYWVHALGLEANTPDAVVTDNRFSGIYGSKVIDNEGLESMVPADSAIDASSFRDASAIFFEGNPDLASVELRRNSFAADVFQGVNIHPALLTLLPDLELDASLNYWGATAGPESGAGVGSNISSSPWYIDDAFTGRSTDPASLSIQSQPGNSLSGEILQPAPVISLRDYSGQVVIGASVSVTLSSGNFSSGNSTITSNDAGLATFSDLVIASPGNYTLSFSTGTLDTVQSGSFTISLPVVDTPDPEPDPPANQVSDIVNDIVIPDDDEPLTEDTIEAVSEAANVSSNLAQDLASNIADVEDDDVIGALDAIGNVAEISGSATRNTNTSGNSSGAESTSNSGKTAINSFSTLLTALDQKSSSDQSNELTPTQKQSVQLATGKAVAAAVSVLQVLDDNPEDRQGLLADLGRIVSSSANLGVQLGEDQASAVFEAADQAGEAEGDPDSDLENAIPVQPRNKALISKESLSDALVDTGIEEAELDSFLAELAEAINPADIQLGDVNGQDSLSQGFSAAGGASVNFDPATGTIYLSLALADNNNSESLQGFAALSTAKQIPSRVTSARIVAASFPSGISIKSDGSAVITEARIASIIVPASHDAIHFYADLRKLGYITSVGNDGNVLIRDADLKFSASFDFLGSESGGQIRGSTSIGLPSGSDEADPGYYFTVHYRDGNSQVLQPFVSANNFITSVKALGATISTDRNSGIIVINDGTANYRFRPSYFVQNMTDEQVSYWQSNQDESGLAYRLLAGNGDGVSDIEVLSSDGAQILYGLPGS